MPRLSTLSNPTGLVEIDKQRVSIATDKAGKRLAFSLARLDLANLGLAAPLNVVVIARCGNAEERVELGSVLSFDRSFRTLTELGDESPWSFRVLLVRPDSAKLVAAAENIRPDGEGDSESFVAFESADLGQRPWDIVILESEGRAVIRFSKEIYRSAAEADADTFFVGLILPEAIRRLSEWVSRNFSVLEDPVWAPFKAWLTLHGITEEPSDSPDDQSSWCNDVVGAFCGRFEFASQLRELRTRGSEE